MSIYRAGCLYGLHFAGSTDQKSNAIKNHIKIYKCGKYQISQKQDSFLFCLNNCPLIAGLVAQSKSSECPNRHKWKDSLRPQNRKETRPMQPRCPPLVSPLPCSEPCGQCQLNWAQKKETQLSETKIIGQKVLRVFLILSYN